MEKTNRKTLSFEVIAEIFQVLQPENNLVPEENKRFK